MDSNEQLRQRVLRLIKLGVSQKVLAAKMRMTPSTFSRWLNKKSGTSPASVLALEGFNTYERELAGETIEASPRTLRKKGGQSAAVGDEAAVKKRRFA